MTTRARPSATARLTPRAVAVPAGLGLLTFALAGVVTAAVPVSGAPADPAALARRFADELFARGDWYRAATEYERTISYAPGAAEIPELTFRAALCSHRAGRHAEAGTRFALLASSASSTELADRCRLYLAAGRYLDGAWDDAHAACLLARTASPSSVHGDRLVYLDGMSRVQVADWPAARAAFETVPPASTLRPSALALADLATRAGQADLHRPWATAACSAVIPGLGQMVCGYHWDGVTALLLTGLSAAIAVDGFHRHSGRLETVGLVLCAVWYPANILGGANAARRANRAARNALVAEADRLSTLSLE
jgi:hypothetical protein